MRWLDGNTDSMDMNLGKSREMVRNREGWHAAVHEVMKSQIWLGNRITRVSALGDFQLKSLILGSVNNYWFLFELQVDVSRSVLLVQWLILSSLWLGHVMKMYTFWACGKENKVSISFFSTQRCLNRYQSTSGFALYVFSHNKKPHRFSFEKFSGWWINLFITFKYLERN